jgi:hypothetical protein
MENFLIPGMLYYSFSNGEFSCSRDALSEARSQLARVIDKIGTPPFSSPKLQKSWNFESEKFKGKISLVNDSVRKFNLIVPMMEKQLIPYCEERELERVINDHQHYLSCSPPSVTSDPIMEFDSSLDKGNDSVRSNSDNVILWGEVWQQIKLVFSWRKSQTS